MLAANGQLWYVTYLEVLQTTSVSFKKNHLITQLTDLHNLTVLADTFKWSFCAAMDLVSEGLHEGCGEMRRIRQVGNL